MLKCMYFVEVEYYFRGTLICRRLNSFGMNSSYSTIVPYGLFVHEQESYHDYSNPIPNRYPR